MQSQPFLHLLTCPAVIFVTSFFIIPIKDNTTLSQMSLLKGEEGCHFKMAFLDSAFGKDEDDKGKGIQGI